MQAIDLNMKFSTFLKNCSHVGGTSLQKSSKNFFLYQNQTQVVIFQVLGI